MSSIEKNIKLGLKLLNNFVDSKISTVKYNDRHKEFIISINDKSVLALCFDEEETENEDYRLLIEIYKEDGFYNFFNIFPNIEKINYEENQKTLEKFRLINSYITGYDYKQSVSNIEDYKYYYMYDGDNYKFISSIGLDDKRYNKDNEEKVLFQYKYYLNLTSRKIDIEKTLTISNLSFTDNSYSCLNNTKDIDEQFIKILDEFAAKPLNKNINELKFSDGVILKMINI